MLKIKAKEPLPFISENCLIPISVHFTKKGLCRKFAIICLPNSEDLKIEPIEPKQDDPNEKRRKQIRAEHKVLLKKLRNRRIRAKRNGKVCYIPTILIRRVCSFPVEFSLLFSK